VAGRSNQEQPAGPAKLFMDVSNKIMSSYSEALPKELAEVLDRAECLYSESQISSALSAMAGTIRQRLTGSNPLVLCVMNGALVTTAQLVIRLSIPLQIDYLHVSRYQGKLNGGRVQWRSEPQEALKGRTVLIVDDILDEGHTLEAVRDFCCKRGAARVLSAVLVQKRHDRKHPDVEADFVALTVDDRYVFGYGMDYEDHLRNLPEIYAVRD
jgi:hypoxanthine phosphoribosyltransferase